MQEVLVFQKGGLVMYGLALLSVYAVAVVIFKIIQFRKANVFDRSFIEPALREIKQGDRTRATKTLAGIRGPVARIMRVTFECVANREMSQRSKEAEILRVGSGDLRYLESHLRGLEMTASVSPLMGLLGTVIGMIMSFSKLSLSGTASIRRYWPAASGKHCSAPPAVLPLPFRRLVPIMCSMASLKKSAPP